MMFIRLSMVCLFVLILGLPVSAQEITDEPVCVNVINEASFSIYGLLRTDFYTRPNGQKARHESSFRLEAAGERHEDGHLIDRAEFCASGPFFPGRRLEFILRTLVPLFSCKTALDQGDIIITGTYTPGKGVKAQATCF